jgi:hypothetical protein
MHRQHERVRRRPAPLRALGNSDPPERVTVKGDSFSRVSILKHDSWAATAIYRSQAGERVISKFSRIQPVFGIPLAWLGRALAARETGFLKRLADVELVPNDLGDVVIEGHRLTNATARSYIDGEPFRVKEQITLRFFDELRILLAAIHARDMAYVDLHKRENIIVGHDGRPYLVDFQVCFGLSLSRPGNGALARFCLARLQEIDIYHFNKHLIRCFPETLAPEQRQRLQEPPRLIRAHRKIAAPLRAMRRKLLVLLRVRDAGGQASSEFEPEDAFRQRPHDPT